jgi:energy-coupling factor transporter ATP-binding protein EcfA2
MKFFLLIIFQILVNHSILSMNHAQAERDADEKQAHIQRADAAKNTPQFVVDNGFAQEIQPPVSAHVQGAAAAAGAGQGFNVAVAPKISEHTQALYDAVLQDCPETIRQIIQLRKQKKFYTSRNKILLVGPSGTGKTTIAQAIAHACDLACKFISAPFLSNKYKNGGEDNLQAVFAEVQRCQPCALVLDEFEAVLNKHDQENAGDQNLLRALWTVLDRCDEQKILVIVTSNYTKELPDQVKTRFPAIYKIDIPNDTQRRHILKFHIAQAKKYNNDEFDSKIENQLAAPTLGTQIILIFFSSIISKTKNLTHRQLAHVIDEASIAAFSRAISTKTKSIVTLEDCFDAIPKVQKSHAIVQDPNAQNAWVKVLKEDPKFVINTGLYIAGGVAGTYIAIRTLKMQESMNLFHRVLALLNYNMAWFSLSESNKMVACSPAGLLKLLKKLNFSDADLGNLASPADLLKAAK